MRTLVFWHKEKKPKDWQEEWSLPMGFFECDRLERGDILSLAMTLDGKEAKRYKVKVKSVEIGILYWPWVCDKDVALTQWLEVH